jgi:hypothetical protein
MNIHRYVSGRARTGQPGFGVFDFIPQEGSLLEIFVFDRFAEALLQDLHAVRKVTVLAKRLGDFADVPSTFVHGFK